MTEEQRKELVQVNHPGWFAIQHKDGWWVGTEAGVICYRDMDLAKVALTIHWQRDGGKQLNFRISRYCKADILTGEYTPEKSAEQALKDYESRDTMYNL